MSAAENKAVFLSYASQDAEAAKRISEALRAAGVEVWFDQSELVGGDAWDQKIRRQIRDCALFVPVISASTQARREGYFRLEWRLATERMQQMDDDLPFLLPIVIDETRDAEAFVPERFRGVQWTRLTGGETSAGFCALVKKLLGDEGRDASPRRPDLSSTPGDGRLGETSLPRKSSRPWIVAAVAGFGLLAALALWQPWRGQDEAAVSSLPDAVLVKPPTTPIQPMPAVAPPLSEARKLAAKADAMFEQRENATRVGLEVADQLVKDALKLEANDAEIWGVQARLHINAFFLGYDQSPARRAAATEAANRAIALAPDSFEARFALASVYRSQDAASRAEAERIMRELTVARPTDRRVWRRLGEVLRSRGQREESLAIFDRAIALPGPDPFSLIARSVSLQNLGRYAEAEADIDASLAQSPTGTAMLFKALYLLVVHGDAVGATAMVQRVPLEWQREDWGGVVAYTIWTAALQPNKAIAALDLVPRDFLNAAAVTSPKGYLKGIALADMGRQAAAELEWRGALQVVETRLKATPTDAKLLKAKAAVLARLGPRADALQALEVYRQVGGQRGVSWNEVLDWVYLDLGFHDELLAYFAQTLAATNRGSWFVTRPALRFTPVLEPLRADPRFQALLIEPANPAEKAEAKK